MSDSTSTPMSDEEIERRLAELEASINAESSTPKKPASAPKVLLGDDDPDDGSLDYLTGATPADSASGKAVQPEAAAAPPAPTAAAKPAPAPAAASRKRAVAVPVPEVAETGPTPGGASTAMPMTNEILDRAIGVARFAPRYYDAIAADPKATAQAALVVAIVAVAGGIGALRNGVDGFFLGVIVALVKWALLSAAAWFVLPKIAPNAKREGGLAPLARTLGYAQGPHVLAIAGIIPLIGWSLSAVGALWVILTSIVAIRQTAKVGFREAGITAVVGWVIASVAAVILALIFGISISAVI